jgi:prepilin-type N-terminal cleavage/methylation domain-containing protein
MRTFLSKMKGCRGFTLIEVIVTLIVAAIMGTILVQFLGTSFLRSADPVIRVDEVGQLQYIMDRMTSDYKYLAGGPDPSFLSIFENRVKTQNYYGSGYSATANYIRFDGSNNEVTDGGAGGYRVLKVTITRNNQSLTGLFTK